MIKKYFNQHSNATTTIWLHNGSTFINGIKYNKINSNLFVKISGNIYKYIVNLDLADQFSKAPSWGDFYNKYIKKFYVRLLTLPGLIYDIAPKPKGVRLWGKKGLDPLLGPLLAEVPVIRDIADPEEGSWADILFSPDDLEDLLLGISFKLTLLLLFCPPTNPFAIGLGLGAFGTRAYAASKGREMPGELRAAMAIASIASIGYTSKGLITSKITQTQSIMRAPQGSIKYVDSTSQLVANMTKRQAVKNIILGGNTIKSMGDRAAEQIILRGPTSKLGKFLLKRQTRGLPFTRAKAPISGFAQAPSITKEELTRAATFRTVRSEIATEAVASVVAGFIPAKGFSVGTTFRAARTVARETTTIKLKKKKSKAEKSKKQPKLPKKKKFSMKPAYFEQAKPRPKKKRKGKKLITIAYNPVAGKIIP